MANRSRRNQKIGLRLVILLLFFLLCLMVLGFFWVMESLPATVRREFGPPSPTLSAWQRLVYPIRLLLYRQDLLSPLDDGGNERLFQVELGESVTSIALRLEQAGLIRNAKAFVVYLVYAGLDTGIQAGEYQLSPAQSAVQIGQALQDATPQVVSLRILAGWRAEEVAAALAVSGLEVTPEQFLRAVRKPELLALPPGLTELKSAEGFLFPDVYRLQRDTPAQGLLAVFLKRFDEQVTPQLRQDFERQGLNLKQAVTLASMVEREAVVDQEKPIIASVFLNRLAQGMKLDSDPTVQYALGYNSFQKTWWSNPLSLADLQIESPYNTYINPGLPPGPICNPGLVSLLAVAQPAQTNYLYFRARCDHSGRHNFAQTYEEHIQNACP